MANWYFVFGTGKVFSSASPSLTNMSLTVTPVINGVNCGTSTRQYRSSYTTISNFRARQRIILGNLNFEKVQVFNHSQAGNYSGQTITTWEEVTDKFTIATYPSSGIIDLTAKSSYTNASNFNLLYIAVDESFESGFTITNELENCVCNTTLKDTYELDEFVTLEYSTVGDYRFNDTSFTLTTGALTNETITLSADKTTATITGNIQANLIVTGVSKQVYFLEITGTFENCTCNYENGEIIDLTKNIIITANEGYEFLGSYTYREGTLTYAMQNLTSYLLAEVEDGNNYRLNDDYNATKKVERIGTFCNLYLTTQEKLTELSKVRFFEMSTTAEVVDYGSFITQLYAIPFPIHDFLKGSETSIILGNYDSKVLSTALITYSETVDGGTITVPEKYNNVYDYLNTECILHLPYFNTMYLNTEYVIGQTITIQYIIDLYSGNVTCNIYSTFTGGGIIETQTQQIAVNIPFIQKQNNSIVGTLSNINKNVIPTAYLEIVRNKPYNVETVFGKETIAYGLIGSYSGYIRVSDVVLNTVATTQEKEEIINLLKDGIFL